MAPRVGIVGAGWAGLSAAVAACERGLAVTVFEAARTPGGRARTVPLQLPDGTTALADNGQHILIGAYVETLALMEKVGVAPQDGLLRLPLTLLDAQGHGLALPDWPAPWDALAGILRARGWGWGDRLALLRAAIGWQLARFRCASGTTVAELTQALPPRVREELVEPLCVAALNTPAARASGEVFLRVLRDSLFGAGHRSWGGSNLLLPRQDLGALFPHAAQAWLQARGASVRTGRRVQSLERAGGGWQVDGEAFDEVVLAAPSTEAARLAAGSGAAAPAWVADAERLAFESIATVYATGGPRLSAPMLALHAAAGAPAQFVFDRHQLGGPAGLLAFVASASRGDKAAIEAEVVAQAASLGWRVTPLRTIVEKRATFACVPGLRRPALQVGPGLWACGDYVEGPYPATLEGAVRSGLAVAQRLAA